MRRGEPPFIGGEEGLIPWNMLDPLISAPHSRRGMLHLEQNPWTAFGTSIRGSPLKMGLFGLIGGAAAPWLGPNVPIFGGLRPVGFLSWPMVVWRGVELVWFDFGLVLHLFWALICLVVASTSWAHVGWCYALSYCAFACIFLCYSNMSSCK